MNNINSNMSNMNMPYNNNMVNIHADAESAFGSMLEGYEDPNMLYYNDNPYGLVTDVSSPLTSEADKHKPSPRPGRTQAVTGKNVRTKKNLRGMKERIICAEDLHDLNLSDNPSFVGNVLKPEFIPPRRIMATINLMDYPKILNAPTDQPLPSTHLVTGEPALFDFLANAPRMNAGREQVSKHQLRNGEYINCVYYAKHFFITGTDIVKIIAWRFLHSGRIITNPKKFEEGVFSDLRNLKPNNDAVLEFPRSIFLDILYRNGCIRTQKKQKVFFWYSVPHDALFCDALERDIRRETNDAQKKAIKQRQVGAQFNQYAMPQSGMYPYNAANNQIDFNHPKPTNTAYNGLNNIKSNTKSNINSNIKSDVKPKSPQPELYKTWINGEDPDQAHLNLDDDPVEPFSSDKCAIVRRERKKEDGDKKGKAGQNK